MWAAAVAALVAGGSQAARGQFSYEFQVPGAGGPVSGSVAVREGSSVALQVYLREQAGGTVLRDAGGLFSAEVRATYASSAVARLPGIQAIARNPAFNFDQGYEREVSNPTGGGAGFGQLREVASSAGGGPGAVPVGPDNRILLGTFTFDAVGPAGQSTILTAADGPGNNTITAGGTSIDSMVSASNIRVDVVPEPGAVLAVAAAAAGAAGFLRRVARRRPSPADPNPFSPCS